MVRGIPLFKQFSRWPHEFCSASASLLDRDSFPSCATLGNLLSLSGPSFQADEASRWVLVRIQGDCGAPKSLVPEKSHAFDLGSTMKSYIKKGDTAYFSNRWEFQVRLDLENQGGGSPVKAGLEKTSWRWGICMWSAATSSPPKEQSRGPLLWVHRIMQVYPQVHSDVKWISVPPPSPHPASVRGPRHLNTGSPHFLVSKIEGKCNYPEAWLWESDENTFAHKPLWTWTPLLAWPLR